MATIVFNSIIYGDHVKCNNCGATLLVPCGCEHCPECGFVGGFAWVDKDKQEVSIDQIGDYQNKDVDEKQFNYLIDN